MNCYKRISFIIINFLCLTSIFLESSCKIQELNLKNYLDCKEFCTLFDDAENKKMCGWDSELASYFLEMHYKQPSIKEDKVKVEYKIFIMKGPKSSGKHSKVCAALIVRCEKGVNAHGKSYGYSEIRILVVDKNYRRKKLATLLLQKAENFSKKNGATIILIKAFSYNDKMIKCCVKNGYVLEKNNRKNTSMNNQNNPVFIQYMYKVL